jgi:CBS domain-containing protein
VTDNATVADVMTSPVLTLAAETPVDEAAAGMLEGGIKSLVVIDDACRPLGIFTSTDAVRLASENVRASETTVGEHMTTDVVTTSPGTALSTVAARLREEEINHLPVTEDDEVVGILTTTDLTTFLADGDAGSGAT